MKTTKLLAGIVATVAVLALSSANNAGNIEPSAPPGPTMKTLDEVEPKRPIQSLSGSADAKYLIDGPGSYYLTADVTGVDPAKHAVRVDANDVTIDLMGYSLVGPASGTGSGIYMDGRRNVEIRNGTVRSFAQSGIYEADSAGRNHRLLNVRVFSNGMLGVFLSGEGHLVKDCTAAANGSTGVYAGAASTLTGNTIYHNDGYGISAGASTITGNTITANDDAGILASDRSMVAGNTISGNNQSSGLTQAGIKVSSSCFVRANAISYNQQNDIYVSGSGNSLEQNLLTNSAGNGINFADTPNFYANNRAHGHTTAFANTAGQTDGGGNVSF